MTRSIARFLSNPMRFMFASLIFIAMVVWTLQAFAQDETQMQDWLKNPWVLFGFMIFGTILSMVKQWKQAQMDGSSATLGTYLSHLQELFIAIGGNILAFFLLVDSGNLNFVSAVSIGYVLNSVADLNPLGGRSTSLK